MIKNLILIFIIFAYVPLGVLSIWSTPCATYQNPPFGCIIDPNRGTCYTVEATSATVYCQNCDTNKNFKPTPKYLGDCECSDGWGLDPDSKTCSKCFSFNLLNCKSCSKVISQSTTWQCDSCSDGYIFENKVCVTCSKVNGVNCKTCSRSFPSGNVVCDSCKTGYFLKVGMCNKCSDGCEDCSSTTDCSKCTFLTYYKKVPSLLCSKCEGADEGLGWEYSNNFLDKKRICSARSTINGDITPSNLAENNDQNNL